MILEIKIYIIAWFIVNFDPLKDLIDYIWKLIPIGISSNRLVDYIYIGLGCQKCFTLYLSLIVTGDIYTSILLSFIAFLQEKIIKRI